MKRFENHLKKHLVRINQNLFISKSDSQYYEKILRYGNPNSPEAHYELGQQLEKEGAVDKALIHYHEAIKDYSPYYSKAKQGIKRLEQQNRIPDYFHHSTSYNKRSVPLFFQALIVFLLFLNLCLLLLLFGTNSIPSIVSNVKQWGTGIEVVHETMDTPYVMYIPNQASTNEIEKMLYDTTLKLGKDSPNDTVLLYGIKTTKQELFQQVFPLKENRLTDLAFVTAEYHPTLSKSVNIRFLHKQYKPDDTDRFSLLYIGTNIVRTALQNYIDINGQPPAQLTDLVNDYPNNYLSYIPNEVLTGSKRISNQYNEKGGWVYNKDAKEIASMFHPNVPQYSPGHSSPIPFQPVEVFVEKETYSLFVKSFPYIILQKQVGLGINNSTPKGTFTIEERVLNPNGKTEDMFGEAGLGMGEIAIHGTYDVKSINNQESLGCIRLLNPDILDVFNFVPKGTAVHIDNKTPSITGLIPIKNRELLIPSVQQRTIQTTDTTFDWAG